MRTNGPTVFGAFLARTQETQEKLLMDSNTATQAKQQTIATFFSSVTPTHGTSQSSASIKCYTSGLLMRALQRV